jgi:purine-binding chemotaxis protein CheW
LTEKRIIADRPRTVLTFTLDGHRYALAATVVDRVVRAVAITPLPESPPVVLGCINVQGTITPVISLRRRFSLPDRPLCLTDQLILSQTSTRPVALLVDEVTGTFELDGPLLSTDSVVPGVKYLAGITKLPDGLLLIHDLERALSIEEESQLEIAINSDLGARND